jgi:IclR family transcriptional regulator, KDG regulon repressor
MSARPPLGRTVARLCDILDRVARAERPVPARTLIADLAIPRSTAYDLFRALTAEGFLHRGEAGTLMPGASVRRLAFAYLGLGPLAHSLEPVLTELQEATGETAQISVLDRGQVLVVHAVSGPRAMRVNTDIGTRLPVNWTAAGRALLTGLPEKQLDYFLTANVRPSPTGRAETSVQRLKAEIRQAALDGYAVELNQASDDAGSIAAPVLAGRSGRAALCLEVPEARLAGNRAQLIDAVIGAARRLAQPGS